MSVSWCERRGERRKREGREEERERKEGKEKKRVEKKVGRIER